MVTWLVIRLLMFTDGKIFLGKHFASVTLFIYKEITQKLIWGVVLPDQDKRSAPIRQVGLLPER